MRKIQSKFESKLFGSKSKVGSESKIGNKSKLREILRAGLGAIVKTEARASFLLSQKQEQVQEQV